MFDQMFPYDLPRSMAPIDRRYKANVEIAPNCPRCDSSNTKFCYYNNYSLTQPRYFCKGCRRYWTKGGSLRNVPIGGGCRKNRRSKSSVRLPGNSGTNDGSRQVASSYCIRPDLALDSICSGSSDHGPSTPIAIDLAMVYSKFLNPDPLTVNEAGSSSGSDQIGMLGELDNYPFDQSGNFESLPIDPNAADQGGDVFSMNCEVLENLAWQEQGYFGNLVPELGMMSHHQDLVGGDWWPSIDQASFGGF